MASTTVSSIQPNLRFGTSFLDSSKYRDRAVNGETLMDKRTGEVVFKRKEDGSLLYFDREKLKLDDYISNLRALMRSNVRFSYPTEYNTQDMDSEYFSTFLLDTQNFIPNVEDGKYSDGVVFRNELTVPSYVNEITNSDGSKTLNLDEGFTISKKMNGIFFKLFARPRDLPLIEFCSNVYDKYFKSYTGTDETYLKEKEKFATSNDYEYDKSNATITFSLHAENPSGSNVDKLFTVYVKLNEWSLILFKENGIPLDFDKDEYQSVTITIQSICLEKMKFCPEILSKEEMDIYNKLLDDSSLDSDADKSKISITHGYVSYFFTKDNYMKIPDRRNTELLNCIGLRAFNDSMRVIGNISSAEGIHVSASVPDEQTKVGLSVWAEKIRNVYNKGETENLPEHITDIESLEKLFGAIETINGSLSIEDAAENFWWKMKTRLTNKPVPSWLGI